MTVRRGSAQTVPVEHFAPIDLALLIDDMRLREGETMSDVFARIDPAFVAHIAGVTERGEYDGAAVTAMGAKLFTNFGLGVDMLVVPPGSGFPPHIHPGHHLLYCVAGRGTFTLNQEVHEVYPGYLSMIEASIPHAVGNPYDEPHVILAFGSPHTELDAENRMTVTTWNGEPLLVPAGPDAR